MDKGQTIIVEGVHIDTSFNYKMLKKYGN